MKSVVVSAPGKVHLMGEHAVVHGSPALITAVNRRLYVSVEPNRDGLQFVVEDEYKEHMLFAVELISKELGLPHLPHVRVIVSTQFPPGYHLGSSAAGAVALSGALMYATKGIWNPERINKIAYEIEKKQHGTPSGGDNTACTFGGFIWYRKELEFLKSMWQVPLKFPVAFDHFYLIDTGKPAETTGQMVSHVRALVEKYPEKMRAVFFENERATKMVANAIKDSDEASLIHALKMGSKTLREMEVVSDIAKVIIDVIESIGGAAKILGGGGRVGGVGYLLCYHADIAKVKAKGFDPIKISLGEEGVRIEKR